MGLKEDESVDHLLIHGHLVSSLWLLSLSLMGLSLVQPSNVRNVMEARRTRLKKSQVVGIWKSVHLVS